MPRTPTPEAKRQADLEGTMHLTKTIRKNLGLSPQQLEKLFDMAGSEYAQSPPGQRWRRYERGERALCASEMDRIARKALVNGGVNPKEISWFRDDVFAFWSIRKLLDQAVDPHPSQLEISEDRRRWLAQHDANLALREKEREDLNREVQKLTRAGTRIREILANIDGRGHDYWSVGLPSTNREVDGSVNTDTSTQEESFLTLLDQVTECVKTLELHVMYDWPHDSFFGADPIRI